MFSKGTENFSSLILFFLSGGKGCENMTCEGRGKGRQRYSGGGLKQRGWSWHELENGITISGVRGKRNNK